MKKAVLDLLNRELSEGPGFLAKETICDLIEKMQAGTLNDDERRLIADHVLGNYLDLEDEDGERNMEVESMIDWLLAARRK